MATIYSRGNKLWMQYYVDGRRKREPLNLEDNRENWILARKLKKQKEVEIDRGEFREEKKRVRNKGILLSEGFIQFIKEKQSKSINTRKTYESAYERFKAFAGDIQLRKVNAELIISFEKSITYKLVHRKIKNEERDQKEIVIKIKLSQNTIECYFRHLRIMFEYFKKLNYISSNPFPIKEKVEKEVVVIPENEIADILERLKKSNREHYKVIQLFLLTGLRASELVKLSFSDINFSENYINIYNSKGRRRDKFPLYKKLRDFLLKEWKVREGKLFNYRSRDSLKFFGRFLEREGFVHYSIHTIRKTFLTNLVNSGLSLYDIKTIARHRDLRTTMRFYLAADMERIGAKINDVVKMGTILDTMGENHLKMVNK